jgi:hypothetical protein
VSPRTARSGDFSQVARSVVQEATRERDAEAPDSADEDQPASDRGKADLEDKTDKN